MLNFLSKKKNGDNLEDKLKKYQDAEGLSAKHLDFSVWYFKNRKYFYISIASSLAVVAVILFGYSFYYFGDYLLRGMAQQEGAIAGLTADVTVRGQRLQEDSLRAKFSKLIKLPNSHYDLVGTITNANEDFWLEFDYNFVVQGEPLGVRRGFALPQEQRYLLALNQILPGYPDTAELVINNIKWHRINAHEIPDWYEYKQQYVDFVVQDKEFLGYDQSGLTENLKLSRLSFDIINQTPYNYYEAPLNIVLYSHGEIVGVAQHIVNNFLSREKRSVELSIVGAIIQTSRIDILPNINIFDQDIIAPLKVIE